MEKALTYLATTDEPCAVLKADMERAEYKLKSIKATVFLMSDGSVADRNATVETSQEVRNAWNAHCDAIKEYNAMQNKRTTEALIIEVWRSIGANRRKGS